MQLAEKLDWKGLNSKSMRIRFYYFATSADTFSPPWLSSSELQNIAIMVIVMVF